MDIPKRLLDTWGEIAGLSGSQVADSAMRAARRLFPGTSPAQLLQTYQFNSLSGTTDLPPDQWLDFRQREEAQSIPIGKIVRDWFMEKCDISECYVKNEIMVGLMRRYGPVIMAEVAQGIQGTGTDDLSSDSLQTWFCGSFKRTRLETELTDQQIVEILQ